ncbi:hypothetical protein EV283_3781 [Sphingomonas sp. BK036]|uniref:hypothetical protein n=1 Tax=Sphingomonas sp. BK036 TaxID=2512122 RepID=UPI00102A4C73|nr:hypothetical protein [Sphingomonas sp. BK036]RZT44876.1 hypothetical protein EV283_3781 [Sphingomonas sp. BK036]
MSKAGGLFALTVARDRQVTGFTDADVTFARRKASDAAFRPYVGIDARTRIEGTRADTTAGYAGVPLTLRAQLVGTASAGVAYRLPSASNCSRRSRRRPVGTTTARTSQPACGCNHTH